MQKILQIIFSCILIFSPALAPAEVLAQTGDTTTTVTLTPSVTSSPTTGKYHQILMPEKDNGMHGTNITGTTLDNLRMRCDTEITNRINTINNAINRVKLMKKLTTDQQNQYLASLQNTISGLTALKTKCDADTDAATLKQDFQAIFTQFRVYAEFMPQTAVLTAIDRLQNVIDQLNALATKLQDRINQAQTAGNNVTTLQAWLKDMQAKLSDAMTQLTTISGLVTPLQPTTFNKIDTRSTFQTSRLDLKAAMIDVRAAYEDAKQIIKALRKFDNVNPSGTVPSVTGTSSITPSNAPSVTESPSTSPSVIPTQ